MKKNLQSMVCFPFKKENRQVFLKNIEEALAHPRVGEVLGVGYEKNDCFKEIEAEIPGVKKEGKLHKLYGSLSDLYTMLIECFAVIQESSVIQIDTESILYGKDTVKEIPARIQRKKAFDVEGTIPLLREDWTEQEIELLNFFPSKIKEGMKSCRKGIKVRFMEPQTWYEVYEVLLGKFNQNEKAWRDLLFRLWIARVLNHTFYYVSKGYEYAMKGLEDMVSYFVQRRLKGE